MNKKTSINDLLVERENLSNLILIESEKLATLNKEYLDINERINQIVRKLNNNSPNTNNLKSIFVNKRYIERKTLKQISEELGYTYEYIRRISSKIEREIKEKCKK